MIVDPDSPPARQKYLLDQADWSKIITDQGVQEREGGDYANERVLWYTSGTVGDSKFYSFSQQQVDQLARSICDDYEITANDRYVGVMSLWHAHGQALYWATRLAGCETRFLSVKDVRSLQKLQPTFISAIPNVLQVIHSLQIDSLRFIRSGSAPLANELYMALRQKFKVPVIEYFGLTEAMSHVFTNPLRGEQRIGTVGVPTQGVRAKLQDGHLWLQSTQAYTQDWFDTGDMATQDQAGYFRILGRSVDQINVKGYKINPGSVEQQLKQSLDDIGQCVVFGTNALKCLYTGSSQKQHIIGALKNIHPACYPDLIQHVDQIPVGVSGKISRSWLNQHFV
jgi:acyl-coenzyme A synthetase/AMP-(fatty) acid ligase